MTTKTTSTIAPTAVESFVAESKIAANRKSAVVRGWQAITPELIELVRVDDQKRIDGLTQHYLARFK